MAYNPLHRGDAPSAVELRAAMQTIMRAAGFARRGRGYRDELGGEALGQLLVHAITLNLAGAGSATRIALAEDILGAAVTACIGPSYTSEHLANGSLGSEGRDAAREWAVGRPPADECFQRLLQANEWATQPTGGWVGAARSAKERIEALADEVVLSHGALAERRRVEAEEREAAWRARPPRRRRREVPPEEEMPLIPPADASKGGDV